MDAKAVRAATPGNDDVKFRTAEAAAFAATWRALCASNGTTTPHYRVAFRQLSPKQIRHALVVERAGDEYVVRFMGTARADRWGQEMTGKDCVRFMGPPVAAAAQSNLPVALNHPCGIRVVGHYVTPGGRELDMENVVVPVANDPGMPQRLLIFVAEISIVGYTEPTGKLLNVSEVEWIDLGAGLPAAIPVQ